MGKSDEKSVEGLRGPASITSCDKITLKKQQHGVEKDSTPDAFELNRGDRQHGIKIHGGRIP